MHMHRRGREMAVGGVAEGDAVRQGHAEILGYHGQVGVQCARAHARHAIAVAKPCDAGPNGLDNHGRRIRISTDSRYQRSDETVDKRWISVDGRPPIRHGEEARQELIC